MISYVIGVITYNRSVSYKLRLRTCPSCSKKGVFKPQEGHVLERRRASSWSMKRVYCVRRERNFLILRRWACVD